MAEDEPRRNGCVTNFEHGDGKMTIWKSGDRFTLAPFGVFQKLHPWTDEPVFQSIAKEMHRLACEVGRLRRREIEIRRELLAATASGLEEGHMRALVDRIIPERS